MKARYLFPKDYMADPSANVFNGRLYIYPSHDWDSGECFDDDGGHFQMKDYHVLSLDDVMQGEVTDHGVILDVKDVPWAEKQMWDNDVVEKDGKYYLIFSAKDYNGVFHLGVAVADKPEGPFVPNADPIRKSYSIDPCVFKDDDGKIYLYYSRCCYRNWVYDDSLKKFIEESNILCVELDNKWWFDKEGKMMPTISSKYIGYDEENHKRKDKFVEIISYHKDPQNWENGHVNDYKLYNGTKKDRRWSEGSTLFYRYINGKKIYFITYSCNNYENEYYGVGIATSTSPLGPFKKQEDNPIIHEIPNCNLYSTGHGSWFKYNGEDYYSFHGRDSLHANRALYIGKMHFDNTKCELINFYRANLIRNK